MIFKGFFEKIKKPIIGLAPMDGITDAPFRHMVCKYSKPSFVVTEFVNVEGLARGAKKMLPAFIYSK
ncbi:MAG: tRNA-dihydrouridine synthase, partial [Patescibacteria group bacterium]